MSAAGSLREWLADKPYSLALSSGFFGFFAHGGVLAALAEESLLPDEVSGSSAGALTGGLWAAGLEPEEIRELYAGLRKRDFWDPAPGAGLLAGRRFRALIRTVSPVPRLESCRRRIGVSVFDLLRMRTRVLASGDLANAVYASCAVPLMFHPLRYAGGLLVDGGLGDRPGLAGVTPGRRVFCHHLPARSCLGGDGAGRGRVSGRGNRVFLTIRGLPRPGPDALRAGPAAWAAAREATLRALDRPPGSGWIEVGANGTEEVA